MKEITIPVEIVKALKANVSSGNEVRPYLNLTLFDKNNNAVVATNGYSIFKADLDLEELPCSMLIKMPPALFGAKKEIILKISDSYVAIPENVDYRASEELIFEVGSEEILVGEGNVSEYPDYKELLATDLTEYKGSNICMNAGMLALIAKTFGGKETVKLFSKKGDEVFSTDSTVIIPESENQFFFGSQLVIMPCRTSESK